MRGEYEAALAEYQKINMPDYFATWRSLAVTYAHLGRIDEAKSAADRMLELNPGYEKDVATYLRDWNWTEDSVMLTLDGLHKAGVDIPDEPVADD